MNVHSSFAFEIIAITTFTKIWLMVTTNNLLTPWKAKRLFFLISWIQMSSLNFIQNAFLKLSSLKLSSLSSLDLWFDEESNIDYTVYKLFQFGQQFHQMYLKYDRNWEYWYTCHDLSIIIIYYIYITVYISKLVNTYQRVIHSWILFDSQNVAVQRHFSVSVLIVTWNQQIRNNISKENITRHKNLLAKLYMNYITMGFKYHKHDHKFYALLKK